MNQTITGKIKARRRVGRSQPLRPVRPVGHGPLVLGDRPGPAAAAGGADRRRTDRGGGGQPGGGAALFGRQSVRFAELHYFYRQIAWIALSMPVMIAISMQPRERLRRLSLIGALVCLVALALVPWLGAEVNGAKRWLNLGVGQFQPSEFLKPFFVVRWPGCCRSRETDKSLPIFTLSAAITGRRRLPADAPAGLRLDHHLRCGVDRDAGDRRPQPPHPGRAGIAGLIGVVLAYFFYDVATTRIDALPVRRGRQFPDRECDAHADRRRAVRHGAGGGHAQIRPARAAYRLYLLGDRRGVRADRLPRHRAALPRHRRPGAGQAARRGIQLRHPRRRGPGASSSGCRR